MVKKIGTHNGAFHCDEALACFMLRLTDEFRDATVVRTRDPQVLATMDIVVDVGGEYDPARHRYDHHQRSFNETLDASRTRIKLSSAGLVYKHFGREIIRNMLGATDAVTELVYYLVYDSFVEEIDAIDNGVDRYPPEVEAKYRVSTDLSSRVGRLNPAWNDPQPDPDRAFQTAMEMTGSEFVQRVRYFGTSHLPARAYVAEAIKNRFNVDPSGQIVHLATFCPWKDHLFALEEEMKVSPPIKFVIHGDTNKTDWRVQCVSKAGSFESRLPLPEAWRGVRDEQLSDLTGIPNCVFVHASGFIGGNKTYDGALQMARQALQAENPPSQ